MPLSQLTTALVKTDPGTGAGELLPPREHPGLPAHSGFSLVELN